MSTRRYSSKLREQQARDTRQRIRAHARALFVENGFTATTVAAIATRAAVSPQTVYAAFGTKAGIIASIIDDLENEADLEGWVARVVTEADPHQQVRIFAGWIRTLFERAAPVMRAAMDARGDPDVDALSDRGDANRRAGTGQLAALLASRGALRQGVDVPSAADRLWLLTSSETYLQAIDGLGWDPAAYEAWLAQLIDHEVLEPG